MTNPGPYPHVRQVIDHIFRLPDTDPHYQVYAILDCARNRRIYPTVLGTLKHYRCLYLSHQLLFMGKMPQVLAKVAPHLVLLNREAAFTRWLISRGWGDNWGIFLTAKADIDTLKNHLRRYLMVRDEETGKPFYFRFYDPRVFRIYLPTCTSEELADFFGPVARYYAESDAADELLACARTDVGLEMTPVDLTGGRP